MRAERAKGARGELEVVQHVKDAGWKDARRTHDGRNQMGRGDIARGPEGVSIEVKRTQRLDLYRALKQCEDDAGPYCTPVLAFRRDGDPWRAVIDLDELLSLLALREGLR